MAPQSRLEQIQEKWTPVFRPDLRLNQKLERFHDPVDRENAVGASQNAKRGGKVPAALQQKLKLRKRYSAAFG